MNSSSDSSVNSDPDTVETDDEASKSQRKRDADAIRDLGQHLTELSASELATIPLPDDVLHAIAEFSRIKANGARKRQLGFLAKRLRNTDIDPIHAALEQIRQKARANTLSLHRVEQWRDRLLDDVDGESSREALTAFLDQYKTADRQQFRHLQAQALKERQMKRPPTSARALFKALRDVLNSDTNQPP